MICPDCVRDMCLFGMMCPREAVVDDDGECAVYIRSALALMDAREAVRPDQADPVEAAEMQAERFAIVDEIFEGVDWKKDNPTMRGLQTPEMPCRILMPEKREEIRGVIISGPIGPLWDEAPRLCRLAYRLFGKSPSAVEAGCWLGRRAVFSKDCTLCPNYMRGVHPIRAKKGGKK